MKNYNVTIESASEIVSSFQVKAANLGEAKRFAAMNKRREGHKGCTTVRLAR